MSTKIQAWETEDGQAVWGTHNPFEAKFAMNTYLADNYSKADLQDALTSVAEWEDEAQKLWAHPSLLTEERWTGALNGPTQEEPDWVPYLWKSF